MSGTPPKASTVATKFVKEYYTKLQNSPETMKLFYNDKVSARAMPHRPSARAPGRGSRWAQLPVHTVHQPCRSDAFRGGRVLAS